MHSPSSIRMKPEPDPLDVGGSPSSSDTASPYTYSNYDGLHNGGGATMVAPPMITDSPGESSVSYRILVMGVASMGTQNSGEGKLIQSVL